MACLFCDSVCEVCQHYYRCQLCGLRHETQLPVILGKRCCPSCELHKFAKCTDCDKLVYTDGIPGDWYCADCSVGCDYCDDKHPTVSFDGNDVCAICYNDLFIECDHCNNMVHRDYIRSDDYTTLCDSCVYEHYYRCSACSCFVHEDGLHIDNDNYYCAGCYEETSSTGDPVKGYTFKRIRTNRIYGVEIETCSALDDYADDGWRRYAEHCGTEFISPLLQGDEGLEYIEELYSDVEPEVDDHCGLHVHIDIRDLTPEQRFTLIKAFKANKRTFHDKVDYARHSNEHCRYDLPDIKPGDDYHSYMERLSTNRYTWVNLNAIKKHGSVEVRLHEATDDPDVVTEWVIFVVMFVESVVAQTAVAV